MGLTQLTKITGPGIKTDTNWVGNNALFTGITTFSNLISSEFDADVITSKSLVGTGLSIVGVVTATDFKKTDGTSVGAATQVTIGVRSGAAVTFAATGSSFNVINRAGGNVAINL